MLPQSSEKQEVILLGTYLSEDGNYEIKITIADENLGYFEGFLTNKTSPLGAWIYKLNNSNTRYAYLLKRKITAIGIYPWYRTPSWDETVFEYWNGAYSSSTDELTMGMSTTYASANVGIQITTQKNIRFIKKP